MSFLVFIFLRKSFFSFLVIIVLFSFQSKTSYAIQWFTFLNLYFSEQDLSLLLHFILFGIYFLRLIVFLFFSCNHHVPFFRNKTSYAIKYLISWTFIFLDKIWVLDYVLSFSVIILFCHYLLLCFLSFYHFSLYSFSDFRPVCSPMYEGGTTWDNPLPKL